MNESNIGPFIERRVKALATVFLTTRGDVHPFEIEHDFGVDLLVRLNRERSEQEQIFGVLLKGTSRSLATTAAASEFLNQGNKHLRQDRRSSFPVIELIFSMDGDKGYFAWRSEPVVLETGSPRLITHRKLICQVADRRALDEIIDRVASWYEKLDALLLGTS